MRMTALLVLVALVLIDVVARRRHGIAPHERHGAAALLGRRALARAAEGRGLRAHEDQEELLLVRKAVAPVAVEEHPVDVEEILITRRVTLVTRILPAERIGITLDTGHANIGECRGLDRMEKLKDRLQALHLNDNDTSGDQHQPPFYGTVDWKRVAKLVATSSYTGRPASFELAMRNTPFFVADAPPAEQPEKNIRAFLADAYDRCRKVSEMIDAERNAAR